ncbi:MAG TPA: hypothetical protein VEY51_19035 [Chondromyces sp.]|nr:hypothetical protein [Chondromyces sp.]
MGKKRIWMMMLIFLLAFTSLLSFSSTKEKANNPDAEAQLVSLVENKSKEGTVYINFQKDLQLSFDNVYLFPPYTTEKHQKKVMKDEWAKIKDIGIAYRDDINLLVFTKNGRIVETIQLPRMYKLKLTEPLNKDSIISSVIGIEKQVSAPNTNSNL